MKNTMVESCTLCWCCHQKLCHISLAWQHLWWIHQLYIQSFGNILLYSQSDSKQIMFWHLNGHVFHERVLLSMNSVLKCHLDIFRVPKCFILDTIMSKRILASLVLRTQKIKYLHYKRNVFLTPIITNFILHWLSLWISRSQLSLMCLKVIKKLHF